MIFIFCHNCFSFFSFFLIFLNFFSLVWLIITEKSWKWSWNVALKKSLLFIILFLSNSRLTTWKQIVAFTFYFSSLWLPCFQSVCGRCLVFMYSSVRKTELHLVSSFTSSYFMFEKQLLLRFTPTMTLFLNFLQMDSSKCFSNFSCPCSKNTIIVST